MSHKDAPIAQRGQAWTDREDGSKWVVVSVLPIKGRNVTVRLRCEAGGVVTVGAAELRKYWVAPEVFGAASKRVGIGTALGEFMGELDFDHLSYQRRMEDGMNFGKGVE